MYVPLWCKSNFSFLEGASHPEELVETCATLGVETMAITDRDGVYGIVEAHVKARELGIRLIIGSEVTLDDGSTLVLLATDREGYANSAVCSPSAGAARPRASAASRWDEVWSTPTASSPCGAAIAACCTGDADPVFVGHELREAFGDRLYALAHTAPQRREQPQEARLRGVRNATDSRRGGDGGALPQAPPARPAGRADLHPPRREAAARRDDAPAPTPSTRSSRRTPSRRCSETTPAAVARTWRSPNAATSRSTGCATAIRRSDSPTADLVEWLRELTLRGARDATAERSRRRQTQLDSELA